MARAKYQAPKGTQDVIPPVSARWEQLLATYARTVERAGYGLVQSLYQSLLQISGKSGK